MTQDTSASNTGYSGYLIRGERMPRPDEKDSQLVYAAFAAEHHIAQEFVQRLRAHEARRPAAGSSHYDVQVWIGAHPGGRSASECTLFSMLPIPWVTAQSLGSSI